jgi:YgiT-type zinc finger domain-containing protein
MSHPYTCPVCQIGQCRPGKSTYLRVMDGERLLSVPGMPVYVCDVCVYREFDADAIARLDALLGEESVSADGQRGFNRLLSLDTREPVRTRRAKP